MRNVQARSGAKHQQKSNKALFKELPYFNLTGSLVLAHGQFNNLLYSELPTKRDLDKLPRLYDLDLFNLNTAQDNFVGEDILLSQCIRSCYFSPYSLKQFSSRITKDRFESSF